MKIAIDGPAGSGKSTVAKKLSQILGIPYLDTGTIYRAFGYIAYKKGINLDNLQSILDLFSEDIKVELGIGETRVYHNSKLLQEELRREETANYASLIASVPQFRERMISFFRDLAKDLDVVAEGRDVGTHIFPDASIKFFINASLEERARRRYEELKSKDVNVDYQDILKAIRERDERDRNRPIYPFKPAEDAIMVDTTLMSVDEVINTVMERIGSK